MSEISQRPHKRGIHLYKKASRRSGTRKDRLLRVLNGALYSLEKNDAELFVRHMQLLAGGLKFEKEPVLALQLLHVYKYCEHAAKNGDYANAEHLIEKLRTTVLMSDANGI